MEITSRLGRSCLVISTFVLFLVSRAIGADLPVIGITEITSGVDTKSYYEYKNSQSGNVQTMLGTQMVGVGRLMSVDGGIVWWLLGWSLAGWFFLLLFLRLGVSLFVFGGAEYL